VRKQICQWKSFRSALTKFVTTKGGTESAEHIKPLHWYVACRLVLEGGFYPDEITPRPPFAVKAKGKSRLLVFEPASARGGERTILGGLKTKSVDVVVTKNGIGPVIAVSLKGALGAFRNLTNRMEEAVGDCTNLHITYPALVYGFMVVLRANRKVVTATGADGMRQKAQESDSTSADTAVIEEMGKERPAEMVLRFHSALTELTGRRGIRNDVSRYETVALALVDPRESSIGQVITSFPAPDSPLRVDSFFKTIYQRYDERYVYGAPDLKAVTARAAWSESSPALEPEIMRQCGITELDFDPRIA
jgi:hypothetical protein